MTGEAPARRAGPSSPSSTHPGPADGGGSEEAALRAEVLRDLDEQMAGTEDWADYTTDTVPITLLRRVRAALRRADAVPQTPQPPTTRKSEEA